MSGEDYQFRRPTHSYGTRFRHRLDARILLLPIIDESDEYNVDNDELVSPVNPFNSPVGEMEELGHQH